MEAWGGDMTHQQLSIRPVVEIGLEIISPESQPSAPSASAFQDLVHMLLLFKWEFYRLSSVGCSKSHSGPDHTSVNTEPIEWSQFS